MAIATVWRWPPDRLETIWRALVTVRTESDARVLRAERLHARLVERLNRWLLAAEEHVLDDVQVVAEREVLVDDLDAERRGVLRARDR